MELAFISITSYASAALINSVLLLLLLTSWRGRLQGGLLAIAVLLTVISNVANIFPAYSDALRTSDVFALESLKQAAWALFFARLITIRDNTSTQTLWRLSIAAIIVFFGLSTGLIFFNQDHTLGTGHLLPLAPLIIGSTFLIWQIEQVYRNSNASDRWAIKYLCLGVGGAITFDIILFIDGLLFNQINSAIWAARGFIQAIAAPLIAISATRNPTWDVKVFVSRSVVFFSGSLVAIGSYLLLVALAGYFLKIFGGNWGETLQITLIFAAALTLAIILNSVHLRGQAKQFIARHFYRNKYEYRDEWLHLTQRLSDPAISSPQQEALSAIRDLLSSPRGALWSPNSAGHWRQTCRWEWPNDNTTFQLNDEAIKQLQQQDKLLDLSASEITFLPSALSQGQQPWLLIPLTNQGNIEAIIQLGKSPSQSIQLDWEDNALVSAASYQVAAYLAFHRTIDRLAEARQFEAYNRLSAFLVHDLKNVVAQLQLVVQNAGKHADNPVFIEDAFATVNNAVEKMNNMLHQLRHRHTSQISTTNMAIDIAQLLLDVVSQRSGHFPVPTIEIDTAKPLTTLGNHEQMLNVLLHIVANAQEATDNNGHITIRGTATSSTCRLEIEDSGCGISDDFIKTQLFRPFKTTKGNAGMGIGVYESKEYIESLGGSIEVTSQVGEGTLFKITLPLSSTP